MPRLNSARENLNLQQKLGQVPNEKEQAKALKEAEVREKELEAERAIQAKLEDDLNNAKRVAGQTELGQKISEAIYEPDPKIISTEETEALYPGRTVKDDGVHESLFQGAYTDKQGIRHVQGGYFNGGPGKNYFGDLTRITKDDLDLDSIKVGSENRSEKLSHYPGI